MYQFGVGVEPGPGLVGLIGPGKTCPWHVVSMASAQRQIQANSYLYL